MNHGQIQETDNGSPLGDRSEGGHGGVVELLFVYKRSYKTAGLLYLLRFERVDNLGAYSIPSGTGLLLPSVLLGGTKERHLFNISNDVGRVKGRGLLSFVVLDTRFTSAQTHWFLARE